MTARAERPHVFANFVASVDGIVAIDPHGERAPTSVAETLRTGR
jgi:hypothetical protein